MKRKQLLLRTSIVLVLSGLVSVLIFPEFTAWACGVSGEGDCRVEASGCGGGCGLSRFDSSEPERSRKRRFIGRSRRLASHGMQSRGLLDAGRLGRSLKALSLLRGETGG